MSDFYNELTTQPQALKTLIEEYQKLNFEPIKQAAAYIKNQPTVIFSGMGTSYFAPVVIRDKLAPYTKMLNIEAGEFYEGSMEMVKQGDVVVLVSQSGESVELVKIANELNEKATIFCITNNISSSLAKCSSIVMPLYCEEEKSITNKTYTNTLAVLFLLAGFVANSDMNQLIEQILSASDEMQRVISQPDMPDQFKDLAAYLAPSQAIHFIGRGGANLVSSYQAALIFMEGAKCATHGFSTGAFRHGPIEVCGEDHRAVIFAQDDSNLDKTIALAEKISYYRSKVILVTNGNYCSEAIKVVKIQSKNAVEFSFTAAMVFELLLVYIASSKNLVAGNFSITSKVSHID